MSAFVWGSPPCTEYSIARTTAKRPRDLIGTDEIVQITKNIAAYFDCPFAFENPRSGLLKTRDVVKDVLFFTDTSYSVYGFPYRKHTRIWHNMGDWLQIRPICCKVHPCEQMSLCGKHAMTAQRGPSKGTSKKHDRCTLDQLHSTPPGLCDDIALAADLILSINDTRKTIDTLLEPSEQEKEGRLPNAGM